jgi:uncharacterized C2H2 Zn-finger protein
MNWFQRFMVGRYGPDQLSVALCVLSFVLSVISNVTDLSAITALSAVALGIAVYRILSRDVLRRRSENQRFLAKWNPIAARFRDRKTHKYFKCPNCGQQLRVPKNKGSMTITCPKCGTSFKRKT